MSEPKQRPLPIPIAQVLNDTHAGLDEAEMWARIAARREASRDAKQPAIPVPVADVLREPPDLAATRLRHWRAITARRSASHREAPWRWVMVSSGLAVTAVLVVLTMRLPDLSSAPDAAVALRLRDGRALHTEETQGESRQLVFADASQVTLRAGTLLTQRHASPTRFDLVLARGSADFVVTPGGPRRWTVDTGLAVVEVVGTAFRVDRQTDSVQVSVSHGKVLVRGKDVPGGMQYLTAGQTLQVHEVAEAAPPVQARSVQTQAPAAQAPAVAPSTSPATSLAASAPQAASEPPAQAAARASVLEAEGAWQQSFAAGRFEEAYRKLGRAGLKRSAQRARDADELLGLADVARLSGHPHEAVFPLTRVLDAFSDSPHTAVAAFTLGRILLDEAAPAAAAKVFERAIATRPPHALLEDCHARLVQAHARAGEFEAAEHAAARYRALFPAGRHLADLERWVKRR